MKNSEVIKGMKTVGQFKAMQFVNENFVAGSLEIELVDDATIKGTDYTGASMLFHWNEETKVVESR